jgi:hypothetical protein
MRLPRGTCGGASFCAKVAVSSRAAIAETAFFLSRKLPLAGSSRCNPCEQRQLVHSFIRCPLRFLAPPPGWRILSTVTCWLPLQSPRHDRSFRTSAGVPGARHSRSRAVHMRRIVLRGWGNNVNTNVDILKLQSE